jgi:hypothetical protein
MLQIISMSLLAWQCFGIGKAHSLEEIRGRISTVIADNFVKGISKTSHILHAEEQAESREIHFDDFPHLKSSVYSAGGMDTVFIRGKKDSKGFSVHHFQNLANSNSNSSMGNDSGTSISAISTKKILLMRLDMSSCGANGAPLWTEQQILNEFSESANPNYQTFGQHLRSCSRGQMNAQISITTVAMPCSSSGNLSEVSGSYEWNSCPFDALNFLYTVFKAVDILSNRGFDVMDYDFFVMLTPVSMNCHDFYGGLATIGKVYMSQLGTGPPYSPYMKGVIDIPQDSFSYSISTGPPGNTFYAPSVLMHEFGHNLGLAHSGSYLDTNLTASETWTEYADYSCNMGGDAYVCFNLPQSEKLGFLSPTLVGISALSMNTWKSITLSASDLSKSSGLRIQTNVIGQEGTALSIYEHVVSQTQNTSIYLSLRRNAMWPNEESGGSTIVAGGDTLLRSEHVGILMHSYPDPRPGSLVATSDGYTVLENVIGTVAGTIKSESAYTGIHVRLDSMASDKSSATISVCRCALNDVASSCCTNTGGSLLNPPTFSPTLSPTTNIPTLSPTSMIISANTDSSTSSPSKNLIYFVTGGIGLAIAVAGIIAYVFIMKKRNLKNKTALADIHSNRIEL